MAADPFRDVSSRTQRASHLGRLVGNAPETLRSAQCLAAGPVLSSPDLFAYSHASVAYNRLMR
jgi:hypothetical protein